MTPIPGPVLCCCLFEVELGSSLTRNRDQGSSKYRIMLAPGLGVLNENGICSAGTKLDLIIHEFVSHNLSILVIKSPFDTAPWLRSGVL